MSIKKEKSRLIKSLLSIDKLFKKLMSIKKKLTDKIPPTIIFEL